MNFTPDRKIAWGLGLALLLLAAVGAASWPGVPNRVPALIPGGILLAALAVLLSLGRIRRELSTRRRMERELTESRAKTLAILHATAEGIATLREDGLVESVNPAVERLFGYLAGEVQGRSISFLIPSLTHPATGGCSPDFLDAGMRNTFDIGREVDGHRKNGDRFPLELSVSDYRLGAKKFLTVVMRDVTEGARVAAELRRVMEAAQEANRAKSSFLANMSHELRTPLNSVIGFAGILIKNRDGHLPPREIDYLRRIHDNGRHLLKLINDILDLTKVESGKMETTLAPASIDLLVRDTLAQLEGAVRERNVLLVPDIPEGLAPLETDAEKLKQILINLVGNALKFTERGSVRVHVTADAERRPTAIEVIDTGVGIPPDRLSAIFDAFQQADNTTARRFGGTGLGLTISRAFCHLLGYEIDVHSRVGGGSTFRIRFPSSPKMEATAP